MGWFRYRTTPLFILVWFSAIWLLHRDVVSQSFLTKDAYIDINNGALIMRQDYMGLYLGGQKVGHKRFILREDSDESETKLPGKYYIYNADSFMRVTALGIPIEMQIKQTGEVNEDLSMRTFRFEYQASGQDTYLQGEIVPGGIKLTSKSEGYTSTKTIPVNSTIYLSDAIHLLLAQTGLEPGSKAAYPVFEPLLSSLGTVHTEVIGKEAFELPDGAKVTATKVDLEFKGLHTLMWINEQGDVYKEVSEVSGMSFTAMRESEEEATDMSFKSKGIAKGKSLEEAIIDLPENAKVPSNVRFEKPWDVASMKFKFIGADKKNMVFDGSYQTLLSEEDGYLLIQTRRVDYQALENALPAQKPPYTVNDPSLSEYIDDDLYIQSSHPDIKKKAMEIAQDAPNAWQATKSIGEWVYRNMRKEMRGTIPSAIEILNKMSGDCTEHSTLFAALARAVGIPTKIIAGLVYTDDGLNHGFYYHAWNEVYLNGKWIPIDSTLPNRIEMDATHIKMAEGSMDQQAGIVNLIGKIQIEIIEHE